MDLKFSSIEKEAVITVLTEMIHIDGITREEEIQYVQSVCTELDLENYDTLDVNHLKIFKSLTIIKAMDDHKKAMLYNILIRLITADNEINKKETDLLDYICDLAEIKK